MQRGRPRRRGRPDDAQLLHLEELLLRHLQLLTHKTPRSGKERGPDCWHSVENSVQGIRRGVKSGHQNLRESIQKTLVAVSRGGHGEATDVLGDGREGTNRDQRERRVRRWEAEKTTTTDVDQEIMLEKYIVPA